MRTFAIANSKGGVGKTTLAVHLATGLAREGHRVLLADLDPQANATGWLLGPLEPAARGVADVLTKGRPPDAGELHPVPGRDGLTVLPSTPSLAGADLALAGEVAGETVLRRALAPLRTRFDFVVLDCPPTLGLTVLSALCAADTVIAPVLGAYLSLTGLKRLEDTCERIRERLGARTRVLGYVLFAADPREAITAEARELLEREAPGRLLSAEVRVSTAAKALPARRETAWDEGADPRGAEDYPAVLAEIMARLEGGKTSKRARNQGRK